MLTPLPNVPMLVRLTKLPLAPLSNWSQARKVSALAIVPFRFATVGWK